MEKDSSTTFQSEIPGKWTIADFNQVCDKVSLNKLKIKEKEYLPKGKYPIIDQGQKHVGGYYNDEKFLVPGEPPFVIFGDHTKVKKYINFKFIAGADGIKVLKPYSIFHAKLFFYLLHVLKIPDKGYARHFQFLEKSKIPLPPLAEQHRIVAKIEELFSDLDKGIESLKTARQQLKIYRQAVLKWAFEGKLTNKNVTGELPEGWCLLTIGDICTNVEYGSAAKSKETGKIPVLRMGNIQQGKFNWDDLVYTSDQQEIEKYNLKKDDVLFNRTNSPEWVGKTAIYKGEQPAIFAGYLIRINYKRELVDPNYLTYYLNSHDAKKYGNKVKSFGVNQSNINGTKLKKYPFSLPGLNEQRDIVKEIESRLSVCDKIEESIKQSLEQAEALRQSILKKAFEGKLVSQDPNDEPAAKLLERIKAEKEKNTKTTSSKRRKE